MRRVLLKINEKRAVPVTGDGFLYDLRPGRGASAARFPRAEHGGKKPAGFPRRRPFSLDISNIGKYNKDNYKTQYTEEEES
ncbi:hypothetical protein [Caproicibacter fermentans]|uniref:hypothetical protein n=1 Tax=Caproicibacter fermentans TaxID=2576756 RepID=UPI0012EDC36F|nr:hypothetical protein [Caproicibacter fermentans]